MKRSTVLALVSILALFSSAAFAVSPGRFTFAGPTSADGDVLSLKWRFGFQFSVPAETIAEAAFSCDSIKESHATASGANLVLDAQGRAFVESAGVPVSKESTPWLYDGKTTKTTCEVVVATTDGKKLKEKAPVTFQPATKMALLIQLDEEFQYNKRLKK